MALKHKFSYFFFGFYLFVKKIVFLKYFDELRKNLNQVIFLKQKKAAVRLLFACN
ncbi:hypothetical protein FC10_GL000430 [Lactobacillus delbrueckii subsp. lactis DSM 20072]|nr:hypothetical protein HMPREF5505_0956 [Lactobacillus delbrueckii subsp. lactis DSM 20072]KRK66735.1 hypothetical protein FC10_GL000430 [Lactobacillus delbrueckii subsp. lactis DSM 20072]